MAFVPDKLGERRREKGVSQTACEIFVKYCEHADQETGLTLANPKTVADAFKMRIDNVQKYDSELQEKHWILLKEIDGRIYRKVEAGWLARSERRKKKEVENPAENDFLKFRETLENLLNFSESSYILGENPKFKEILLNFRNAYKEVLDQPIDQPNDQPTKPEGEGTPAAPTEETKKVESPAKPKTEGRRKREGKKPDLKTRPDLNDEDYLVWLKEQPENTGIPVNSLYRKMLVWCEKKGRTPSRMRLLNWIDGEREASPMTFTPIGETQNANNGSGTNHGTANGHQANNAHLKPKLLSEQS